MVLRRVWQTAFGEYLFVFIFIRAIKFALEESLRIFPLQKYIPLAFILDPFIKPHKLLSIIKNEYGRHY
jgi:hypothetical protein